VSGEHEHANIGQFLREAAENIYTVETGKLGVQDDDVGLDFKTQVERVLAIAAFADELVVAVVAKDFHQHFPNSGLVLDNNETFHRISE